MASEKNQHVQIKRLGKTNLEEFRELINLFSEVFETENSQKADDIHLNILLSKEDFIVLAALTETKIVGGLTAYQFPAYSGNFSELYIYDIAINKACQRTGIGKMLIGSLKEYGSEHNIKTVFVEAHEEDIHAINFYLSTKASPEKVIHFNYELTK